MVKANLRKNKCEKETWKKQEFKEHNSDVQKKNKWEFLPPWLVRTWKDFHKLMKD